MPIFQPGVPITTEENAVEVEIDQDNPLPPGRHVFELRVVDDEGKESRPATVEVIIRDSTRPTAVIDAPREVEAGETFKLSGERSSDVEPGRVVSYIWTLRDRPQ